MLATFRLPPTRQASEVIVSTRDNGRKGRKGRERKEATQSLTLIQTTETSVRAGWCFG